MQILAYNVYDVANSLADAYMRTLETRHCFGSVNGLSAESLGLFARSKLIALVMWR